MRHDHYPAASPLASPRDSEPRSDSVMSTTPGHAAFVDPYSSDLAFSVEADS